MDEQSIMAMCLEEARRAYDKNEVPVGALVVADDHTIVSRAHNLTRTLNNPTAHAEVLAVEAASNILGNFRLNGYTLYVTKEPCLMCAGAIIESRIKRVVFGCFDSKRGAFGSLINANDLRLNHKVDVTGGVLQHESEALLRKFFRERRGTEVVITGPTRNRLYA